MFASFLHRFMFFAAIWLFHANDAVSSVRTEHVQDEQGNSLRHRKLIDDDESIQGSVVQDSYIVKFKEPTGLRSRSSLTVAQQQQTFQSLLSRTSGGAGRILRTYSHVFQGAAVSGVPRTQMISILNSDNDDIEYATPVKRYTTNVAQVDPVWNLDRIDQSGYPLSETYNYNYNGTGVTVYIFDTGIKFTHSEFIGADGKSRASCSFNAFAVNETCSDLQGHGTHVAATAGGKHYGVAKNVQLRAVKVLDQTGYGDTSGVLAGLDHVIGLKKRTPTARMVINMSIGGPSETPLNAAVNKAVDAGIFVAVAAGNDGAEACSYSPAGASKAVTVGATKGASYFWDEDDSVSNFSNQGKCVDIFAPGSAIISASLDCHTCSKPLDGTSMACPHVAGAGALYLHKYPTWTPAQITADMKSTSIKDKLGSIYFDGTPNLMLNVKI